MAKKEELYLIKNEKIVNESLAKIDRYYEEIKIIIEKWDIETDKEKSLALITMNALFKKLTLDRAIDKHFSLNINEILETVPGGKSYGSCEECDEEDCEHR